MCEVQFHVYVRHALDVSLLQALFVLKVASISQWLLRLGSFTLKDCMRSREEVAMKSKVNEEVFVTCVGAFLKDN